MRFQLKKAMGAALGCATALLVSMAVDTAYGRGARVRWVPEPLRDAGRRHFRSTSSLLIWADPASRKRIVDWTGVALLVAVPATGARQLVAPK
jgi:hypothetical protein